jgi:hypothetical protein
MRSARRQVTVAATDIHAEIVEQVEQLERLRVLGHISDEWYHKSRAHIVRRHREARAAVATGIPEATRTTIDLQRPA